MTHAALRCPHAALLALLLVTSAVAPLGCVTDLTPGGQRVQLMKGDPPAGCKEVGSVTGDSKASGGLLDSASALEQAKNAVRNRAATQGANYVRWESNADNGSTLTGTAFACPDGVTPGGATSVAMPATSAAPSASASSRAKPSASATRAAPSASAAK